MITTIPFAGFYESVHSYELDRALEDMVSDSSGCHPISERISNDMWDAVNWGDATAAYAKEFAEHFAVLIGANYGVALAYESMRSPREYNFATDRLFCTISEDDARKLLAAVSADALAKQARERFTSRSGFISYYSPDVATWGDVAEWDHNQLGTLLAAAVDELNDEQWEDSIVERMSGNGITSDAVSMALNTTGQRLTRIAYYLRQREERQFRR